MRRKWAARYVPFMRRATLATSASVRRTPGVATACPAAEASPTTLRIARTHLRPRSEMLGAGEARQLGADLGRRCAGFSIPPCTAQRQRRDGDGLAPMAV